MSELIKKPYKISLWEDEQIYLIKDKGADDSTRYETTTLPESGYDLLNKYVRENCLAIIGSNTMDTPIRAFEPKLVRQTNGTNTLTFQIFYRYYDEDDECFKLNPFTNLLVNERKVKLFYDGEWFDFVIKQIQEDSQKYTFTYTCQDLYISELSKNGYNLIFDTELENNMGTVTELGTSILEGTDWRVGPSDTIKQKNGEVLFTYETPSALEATVLQDLTYKNESWKENDKVTIPANSIIFICYSSYALGKNGDDIQFFWRADGRYQTDDDGNIINSPNYTATAPESLWTDTDLKVTSDYRGLALIKSKRVKYIPQIQKYCYSYKRGNVDYYAYMGSDFSSFKDAENLLTNSAGFISTSGWLGVDNSTVTFAEVKVNDEIKPCLNAKFGTSGKILNTGLYDSKALLQENKGFTIGEKYIFAIKCYSNQNKITGADITYLSSDSEYGTTAKSIFECTTTTINDTRLSGYKTFLLTCNKSVSYTDLVKGSIDFYVLGSGTVEIQDAKLFKRVYSNGKLIIPDLETEISTEIKDKYFFFKKSEINSGVSSTDDITFSTICYEDEIATNGYISNDVASYEKVTSITASKSNRFNLIQELCEAFECWAKFNIGHNSNGSIITKYIQTTDTAAIDGKKYYKKIGNDDSDKSYVYTNFSNEALERTTAREVCFKEYVGKENYAGFRYGINLKSITRSLDTKQIVTKLIVEPNSNEYAPDGFCTIQTAAMNPTGETAIYNFQYYLNNGLLNKNELHYDLYDTEKGIGLYTKLSQYNKQNTPLIEKQSEISITLSQAIAKQQIYNSIVEEAKNQLEVCIEDINDALNITNGNNIKVDTEKYNDVINSYIRQRDSAKATIERYDPLLTNMTALVNKYTKEYNTITEALAKAREKIIELNNEFFRKYSRYIQEGTWISEDYVDDDLYYMDACGVSRASAFPQVSYTINVIDISGIEEYKNYNFTIGDKTYIEDVEFFGYVPETKRPYQEEVIVAEVSYSLDNPADNTIKVQNYKTQFEDLFQRVAAATQALQYAEGKYNKASSIVDEDGTISGSVLERTLNFNYCLADAISKEISNGGKVVEIQSTTMPNRLIKISGLGIELSRDAGQNWQTAITADGINADVGVFGSLHTNNLRIYNGDDETFFWDKNGITAYAWNEDTGTIYNKFVRMDKYGIYGYVGNQAEHYSPISEMEIHDNAVYALTWDGLSINSLNGLNKSNYVRLSTNGPEDTSTEGKLRKIIWAGDKDGDNFVVYEDGTIKANNGHFEGTIKATGGEFTGDVNATTFKRNGVDISNLFAAKGNENGELTELTIGKLHIDPEGNISFNGDVPFKSIKSTTVEYQSSTSGTSAPTGTWSTTIPSVAAGNYLWTRTTIKYTQGDDTVSYSVSKIGADGKPGENGSNANVTFNNIKSALYEASKTETSFITATKAGSPNIYGGNIYGGTIYAGSGDVNSKIYSKMSETGFEVYHSDASKPKVSLNSNANGDNISLVLGAGNGAGGNTFVLSKTSEIASLIYMTSKNEKRGIEFTKDGKVTIYGNMNASAVAVFG